MNVQQKQKEKGFTIIEVVLVLAIAGLIFLMVFIALPALQRSQRDSQRKNDLSRVLSQLQQYQSNNRNALPTNWSSFETDYLATNGDSFVDPSGASNAQGSSQTTYAFMLNTNTDLNMTFADAQNTIYYAPSMVCNGEQVQSAGSRKIAFRMKLEGGGIICQNN